MQATSLRSGTLVEAQRSLAEATRKHSRHKSVVITPILGKATPQDLIADTLAARLTGLRVAQE